MSALTFVVRPQLFCGRCGAATWAEQITPEQRKVQCLNANCAAFKRTATINDPKLVLLERPSDMLPEGEPDVLGSFQGPVGH